MLPFQLRAGFRGLVCSMLAAGLSHVADAQPWPHRPVRLVVPYVAGGGMDGAVRLTALRLQEQIGQPVVAGAKVSAEIVAHDRGKKIIIFKFRRRKNYVRRNGHRQDYTAVKIAAIEA